MLGEKFCVSDNIQSTQGKITESVHVQVLGLSPLKCQISRVSGLSGDGLKKFYCNMMYLIYSLTSFSVDKELK